MSKVTVIETEEQLHEVFGRPAGAVDPAILAYADTQHCQCNTGIKQVEEQKPRSTVLEVIYGKNPGPEFALHTIHDIRERLMGNETGNEELLLRCRVAELEWLLDEANCMIDALKPK